MVGHKYNLKELVIDLKADGLTYTTTEFCQGRVTRWGLAWTYQNYDLSKMSSPRQKTKNKNVPITFVLPELTDPINKLKDLLHGLQIVYKVITKRKNDLNVDIVASVNTWANQRRKRRNLKRLSDVQGKRSKFDLENASKETSENTQGSIVNGSTEQPAYKTSSDTNTLQLITETVVHGLMKITTKDKALHIEAEFLNGSAGKEGLHQIVQYIKNNWK